MPRRRTTIPTAWETAIADWADWLTVAGKSPATVHLRRSHLRCVALRAGTHAPGAVTEYDLVQACRGEGWSLEHRRSVRTALMGFFEWCVRTGVTETNPAAELPRVPNATPRPRPVTDAVWRDLLDSAPPRELVMIRLAGEAGLRRAEVAQVHLRDLNQTATGAILTVHGKGRKLRTIPISDALADLIRAGGSGHTPGLAARGETGYLFPGNHGGGHLSARYTGELVSALLPDGVTMHCLRHAFASRVYRRTRNLRAVQLLLGHTSIAVTQTYLACDDDEVRAAMMTAVL